MKIKMYKLDQINPAKYNPRKISDKELSGLVESVKKFGMVDPLVVNTRGSVLCGGHMRLRVAEILKHKTVPVVEVDLSPVEEKALNIVLNSPTIAGKFDEDILGDLLKEVKGELPDLFDGLNFGELGDFDLLPSPQEKPEVDIDPNREFENTCPKCGFEYD